MSIHPKEDLIVELALMHNYRIVTVLPFSKYASPIFVQRNHNGKLRLLVDLRKIKTLIVRWLQRYLVIRSTLCQTQHNTGVGSLFPAAWLLLSVPLFADGEPTVSWKSCTQFYQQNFCLPKTCTRSQQICVCIFKFQSRVLGHSCQRWPVCSKRGQ